MSYLSQPAKEPNSIVNKNGELVQTGFQWPLQSQAPINASWVVTVTIALACVIGLLGSHYFHESDQINHPFRTLMMISLAVVIPLLIIANLKSRQGSVRWTLVMFGILFHFLHLSLLFLFRVSPNPISVFFGIAVVASGYSLIDGLINLDFSYISSRFRRNTPNKVLGFILMLSVFILITAELVKAMDLIMRPGHFETLSSSLILNLILVLPIIIFTSRALWLRQETGFALALMIFVKLALTGILFASSLYLKDAASLEEGIKLELLAYSVMGVAGITGLVILLSKIRMFTERN